MQFISGMSELTHDLISAIYHIKDQPDFMVANACTWFYGRNGVYPTDIALHPDNKCTSERYCRVQYIRPFEVIYSPEMLGPIPVEIGPTSKQCCINIHYRKDLEKDEVRCVYLGEI